MIAARRLVARAVLLGAACTIARVAGAQVRPDAHWQTLRTAHFDIHFTPELYAQASRAGVNAERAYAELATVLHPPRGRVDLVISDAVDYSNGEATPYPSNRIVIYATPPVSESALRFTDDWNAMVITHELTHIFQLDRTRGIWRLGQYVFGRAPELFPTEYGPSWLLEGMAVHMESKFTGAGRIRGSEHTAILRAAAIDHTFPGIGSASLAQGRFPFGESAYAFGSMFVDWLARTHGDSSIRRFVDASSAELVPFWLDIPAKKAFGTSLGSAWTTWRDSIARSVANAPEAPIAAWRTLTTDGVFVYSPRWLGDSALVYTGNPGREAVGAYVVHLDGRRERFGRRNEPTPNIPLPSGEYLYARLQYTGPWELRTDLYRALPRAKRTWLDVLLFRKGEEGERLTSGARLANPDLRASDGAIVAVQIVPAGTRLVRVSLGDGSRETRVTPLTGGGIDEQWTEPRWSHRGDRIAAVRWREGGISEIVVLDTLGAVQRVVASGHSVQATPSWLPDDKGLVYMSDRTGTSQVYAYAFEPANGLAAGEHRLTSAATGAFDPQLSPDGRLLALVELRGDGYHLGVAPCCTALPDSAATVSTTAAVTLAGASDSDAVHAFSPWRSLVPRYWLPTFGTGLDNDLLLGATTSGSDVVGRHSYAASLYAPVSGKYLEGGFAYEYAGLGNPLLQLRANQDWGLYSPLVNANHEVVGELRRRTQDAELSTVFLRRRTRGTIVGTLGTGVEHRTYVTDPDTLVLTDPNGYFAGSTVPRVFGAVSWSSVQYPAFAISPEDGLSFGITARERLGSGLTGKGGPTLSLVSAVNGYKSLDLPGFAHHVLAARVAAGWSDTRAAGYFDVGGTSGNAIEVVPGYTVGEGFRTFGVRGFPAGSASGVRALGGSVEYRAPLVMPGRGLWLLPMFIDRSSLTLFGDAASAWCPDAVAGREVCGAASGFRVDRQAIASLGAEIAVHAALLSWDAPYRLRLGVAHPVRGMERVAGVKSVSVYAAAGWSF